MAEMSFDDLHLSDDDKLIFDIKEEFDESQYDPNLCLVGRFFMDRPIRLDNMRIRMS